MALDPVTAGLDLIKLAAGKIWPDPTVRAEQLERMEKLRLDGELEEFRIAQSANIAQIDLNKVEASHTSIFVAGWRPFIGWVCGVALAYGFIIEPILRFLAKVTFGYEGEFPVINLAALDSILLGMLGLGTLRTVEKVRGVSNAKV
jgi:hypothetical protein